MVNQLVRSRAGLNHRHEYHLFRLLAHFSGEAKLKVLEIGPGSGWFLSYNRPGLVKYALDRDDFFREQLEKAGVYFSCIDVEQLDVEALPTDFHDFDLIVITHIIEHIHNVDNFVSQIGALLNAGGCVYVRTPDITRVGFRFYNDYTHIRPFSRPSLSQLFRTHGFLPSRIGNTSSSLVYLELAMPSTPARIISNHLGADIEALFKKAE
jgi:SAM-dependent methyltransferase